MFFVFKGACVGNARPWSQLRKVSAAGNWMHTGP